MPSQGTHFSTLRGNIRVAASPTDDPQTGEFWLDSDTNQLFVYDGDSWVGSGVMTTSTSTSSTSTSTSTTA